MKFSELNPEIRGTEAKGYEGCNEFRVTCPICHQPFSFYARLNGPEDRTKAIWQWTHVSNFPAGSAWDSITVEPSIQNHPHARNLPACPAHFSIIKGEVVMS
jgi:hypothetical protein